MNEHHKIPKRDNPKVTEKEYRIEYGLSSNLSYDPLSMAPAGFSPKQESNIKIKINDSDNKSSNDQVDNQSENQTDENKLDNNNQSDKNQLDNKSINKSDENQSVNQLDEEPLDEFINGIEH